MRSDMQGVHDIAGNCISCNLEEIFGNILGSVLMQSIGETQFLMADV